MIEDIVGDYKQFIETIMKHTSRAGIQLADFSIDHIAYRTDSMDVYLAKKKQLEKFGKLVSENIVGGRPIAIFALKKVLRYKGLTIQKVELMAPKADNTFPNGLQHLEFIVPSLHKFVEKYHNLNFETDNIDREEFPEVVLKFSDKTSIHVRTKE